MAAAARGGDNATAEAAAVDGTARVGAAGGVGEADAVEVNPMGTPKRSTGAAEDAAGADGAVEVEVIDGVGEAEGADGRIGDNAEARPIAASFSSAYCLNSAIL